MDYVQVEFQAVQQEACDGCRLPTMHRDSWLPQCGRWPPWAGILPGFLQGRYCAAFVLLPCLPLSIPGRQRTWLGLCRRALAHVPRCRGMPRNPGALFASYTEPHHLPCRYNSLVAAAARQTASSLATPPRWSPPRQGATLLAFTTGTRMQASGRQARRLHLSAAAARRTRSAAGPPSEAQLVNLFSSCSPVCCRVGHDLARSGVGGGARQAC